MKDTIIFSGTSNTFGLGLEWELDTELNSDDYLQNGINLPIVRLPHYESYWRSHRWTTLVSKEFGYNQYNVHDSENDIKIGGNSFESIWMMVRDADKLEELFARTKYVIFEVGYIRWYDESLHGSNDGKEYPSTIQEMIDLINNPNSDNSVVAKALEWILNMDNDVYSKEMTDKFFTLQKKYPDIKFLILPWGGHEIGSLNIDNFISIKEGDTEYSNVFTFLKQNELLVYNKAKGFNGNYKFNRYEDHASVEGHRRVANIVINHLKKLEKNEY